MMMIICIADGISFHMPLNKTGLQRVHVYIGCFWLLG